MKKRNILAIIATLSVILVAFTACGDKEKDKEDEAKEKETTSAAEETTEKSGEDQGVIEYIEVTVPVTDAAGEAVTDENGETKFETVTKPAPTQPDTDAPENNDGTSGESVNTSDRKLQKLANEFANKDSFAFDGTVSVDGTDLSVKMYVKGDKVAMEADMSVMAVRIIYANNSVKMLIPSLKCYMTVPADSMGDMNIDEMTAALNDIVDPENLEYVGTTNEKVNGKSYVCETYKDGVNTNKYYFDSSDNLKLIEIIDADGNKNVTKLNEFSSNVPDSVFSIPSGYTELTEDQLNALMGG